MMRSIVEVKDVLNRTLRSLDKSYLAIPSVERNIIEGLLEPVVVYLRSLGIRLIIYLDDLLIINSTVSGFNGRKKKIRYLKVVIDFLQRRLLLIITSLF